MDEQDEHAEGGAEVRRCRGESKIRTDGNPDRLSGILGLCKEVVGGEGVGREGGPRGRVRYAAVCGRWHSRHSRLAGWS